MNRDDKKRSRREQIYEAVSLLRSPKVAISDKLMKMVLHILNTGNSPGFFVRTDLAVFCPINPQHMTSQIIAGVDIEENGESFSLFMNCEGCQKEAKEKAKELSTVPTTEGGEIDIVAMAAQADALIEATGHGAQMAEVFERIEKEKKGLEA